MADSNPLGIMDDFDRCLQLHSTFTERVARLIGELLSGSNLRVHSITHRVKDRGSFEKKLARPDAKYQKLSDVTDTCGVRIITYFEDEVDAVADVIQKEFDVNFPCSVDKRALLEPDRFGYVSLHYICKFSAVRLCLPEYRRFSDCVVEIQVRSILQHTWAEIEHDLGYKSALAIPKEIRRRFSRLAGLLEIADCEFVQLRDRLQDYERAVTSKVAEAPTSVAIDQASLSAYIRQSTMVHELDKQIAPLLGALEIHDLSPTEFHGRLATNFDNVGLKTIAEISSALETYGGLLIRFAAYFLEGCQIRESINAGISLFYLCYFLALRSGKSREDVIAYLEAVGIGGPEERTETADKLLAAFKRIR